MAGYRANNVVAAVAIIIIVFLAAMVLYFVFGGEYATNIPPSPTPAPVVPEVETSVDLPRIYDIPPEQEQEQNQNIQRR